MAAFNPEVGGVPSPNMPDQTGASRGVDTNRAFEYLFKGIGDAVGGIAAAVDNDIKKKIEYEAQGNADTALKPYTDTIPNELRDFGSAFRTLQTAYEQGKLTDVYYTGQLTTMTKAMRAKYPGYESYVDDTIQSVTGIRPANAYREALMQEFQTEANKASDDEKFKRQWEKDNMGVINYFFSDYFTNPGKYDFNAVQQKVADWKTVDATRTSENLRLDNLAKQNNLTVTDTTQVATTHLNQTVNDLMDGFANTLGIGGDEFQKKIASMQDGANFSGEEYNNLVSTIGQAEQQMRTALMQQFRAPLAPNSSNSYSSILSGKEKEMIDAAMAPFLQIKQMVTDKEFGLAGTYVRILGINGDKNKSRILNASPELADAMFLQTISPELGMSYLNDRDPTLKGIFGAIAAEVPARIVTGNDTLTGVITRVVESKESSADKVAFVNSTINKLQEAITSGNGSSSEVTNAATALFEISKGKDVFDRVNQDEFFALFNKMYNPQMTEALAANGTKKDMQNYLESARARIGQIPELAKAAGALGDVNSNWRDYFEIKFDDKSGRLLLNTRAGGVPMIDPITGLNPIDTNFDGKNPATGNPRHSGIIGAMDYSFNKKVAEDAINKLNVALDTYGGIAEKLGMDPSMKAGLYSQVLKELNVNLEQGSQKGLFKLLQDSVNSLAQSEENVGQQLNDVAFNMGSSPESDTTVQGYIAKVAQAESGGSNTAKNPNSSATGKYQFTSGTWTRIKSQYPELNLGDRTDPVSQDKAMAVLTKENSSALSESGIPLTDGNLYAAHFLGAQDATEVLTASDDALVSDFVSPRVIKANPQLAGMTVLAFKRWAANTIG